MSDTDILITLRHMALSIGDPVLTEAADEIETLRDMLRRAMEHGLNGADFYHALKAYDLACEIRRYLSGRPL
jgi:hypothetical protein